MQEAKHARGRDFPGDTPDALPLKEDRDMAGFLVRRVVTNLRLRLRPSPPFRPFLLFKGKILEILYVGCRTAIDLINVYMRDRKAKIHRILMGKK